MLESFVDYLGLSLGVLAIMITLIGATVFFYVAIVTVQRNAEARAVRTELDELRKTLHDFKNSVEPELKEHRQGLAELRKEVQNLKK